MITMFDMITAILEKHKIPTEYRFADTLDNAKRGVEDYYIFEVDPVMYDWEEVMVEILAELNELQSGNAPTIGMPQSSSMAPVLSTNLDFGGWHQASFDSDNFISAHVNNVPCTMEEVLKVYKSRGDWMCHDYTDENGYRFSFWLDPNN